MTKLLLRAVFRLEGAWQRLQLITGCGGRVVVGWEGGVGRSRAGRGGSEGEVGRKAASQGEQGPGDDREAVARETRSHEARRGVHPQGVGSGVWLRPSL